jgi:hypothetical protein
MTEDERVHEIVRILYQYSARPPLKFPTEAEIPNLAKKILKAARGPTSLWTKWGKDREEVVARAADIWVPLEDLRDALNELPGERLTQVDVEQRIKALRHDHGGYSSWPDEELKAGSFAAFAEEKANGTEFIAILGWLEEWTWGAGESLRRKREEERRKRIEQDKQNAEARLRSGADCPWTALADLAEFYCRKNARLFRLKVLDAGGSPLSPRFEVLEVKSFEDKRGVSIGRYRTRTDASKAILEVAYKPMW